MAKKDSAFSIPSHVTLQSSEGRSRFYFPQASVAGDKAIYSPNVPNTSLVASVHPSTSGVDNHPRSGYKLRAYAANRVILENPDFDKGIELSVVNFMQLQPTENFEQREFVFVLANKVVRLVDVAQVRENATHCLFDGIELFTAQTEESLSLNNVNTAPPTLTSLIPFAAIESGSVFRMPLQNNTYLLLDNDGPSCPGYSLQLSSEGFTEQRLPTDEVLLEEHAAIPSQSINALLGIYDMLGLGALSRYMGLPAFDSKLSAIVDASVRQLTTAEKEALVPMDHWVSTLASEDALTAMASALSKVGHDQAYILMFKGFVYSKEWRELLSCEQARSTWLYPMDEAISLMSEAFDGVDMGVMLHMQFKYKRGQWYAIFVSNLKLNFRRDTCLPYKQFLLAETPCECKISVLAEELARLTRFTRDGVPAFTGFTDYE
jgi:hypothetical protein